MVTRIVELGIGFIHIPVSGVGLDDIHDLMTLSIIYLIGDRIMSINIGDCYVGNEVLGQLHSHIRLSC